MMAAANYDVPVDFTGRQLTLDDVKEMLRVDVEQLAVVHALLEQDAARRSELGIHIANRRLLNLVSMWEKAHDTHWAWYNRMKADAAAEQS